MNFHELTCTIAIVATPRGAFIVRGPQPSTGFAGVQSCCDYVFQRMSRFSDVGWELRMSPPELIVSNGHIKEFKDIPVLCEGGKIDIYYALAAHLRMMGAIANE